MATSDRQIDAIITDHPRGVIIAVQVVPGASRSEVMGVHGTSLRVRLTALPERGRANEAVCKLLSQVLERRVDLVSGATSRIKRVLVHDAAPSEIRAKIASICR